MTVLAAANDTCNFVGMPSKTSFNIYNAKYLLEKCIDTHALYDMESHKRIKKYRGGVGIKGVLKGDNYELMDNNLIDIRLIWKKSCSMNTMEYAEKKAIDCFNKINKQIGLRKKSEITSISLGGIYHQFPVTDPEKIDSMWHICRWISAKKAKNANYITLDEMIALGFYDNYADIMLDVIDKTISPRFFPHMVEKGQVYFPLTDCIYRLKDKRASKLMR